MPWASVAGSVAGDLAGRALNKVFGDGGTSFKDMWSAQEIGSKWQVKTQKRLNQLSRAESTWAAQNAPTFLKQGWEKAGIHPIYGMGGSSASFSPSFQASGAVIPPSGSVGTDISAMGNNISRAAEAYALDRERLQNRMLESQITGSELENVKRASDARLATLSAPPGLMNPEGSKSVSHLPGHVGLEAASSPAIKRYTLGRKGGSIYAPTQELAESLEGMGHIGSTIAGLDVLLRGVLPEHIADIDYGILKRLSRSKLGRRFVKPYVRATR